MNALKLARINWAEAVDIPTSKTVLEAIERRAVGKWGEKKWRAELARETVKVLQSQGDADATYETRRSQLYRVFETYSCTLDTAIALAAAVGCRFQMACVQIEVEEF
jgi:hypothetical protein